jgi:hypothetical protein
MSGRTTVYDLQSPKGLRKWLQLHADTAPEASAMDDAAFERFLTLATNSKGEP